MGKETKNRPEPLSPYQQWLQTWKEFEQDFSELPDWTQKIIIQDIKTALENRITAMKRAKQKNMQNAIEIEPNNCMQVLVQNSERRK
jgi:hypothetical protein